MTKFRERWMLFLAFVLCMPMIGHAQSDQGWSGSGNGTESDPFRILDASDLDQLRNFLGKSGVCFKLMDNIDLTDWITDNNPTEGWQPIGVGTSMFSGVLDGNGKTISGIMINRPSTEYVGLFGALNGATIKNLTLTGSSVKGANYTGTLAGYTNGTTTISSCTISAEVTGAAGYHGGAVGRNDGTLTLTSVKAMGDVSGTMYIGGLVGCSSASATLTAIGCAYVGNVTGTNQDIGGLVGVGTTITLTNCSSEGNVKGDIAIGGLVGKGWSSALILTSCTSTGDIIGTGNYVGGVVGVCDMATLTKCSYNGNIKGTNHVGGLVGEKIKSSGSLKILHSFAVGEVNGDNCVGGLVGEALRSDLNYVNAKNAATNYSYRYSDNFYYVGDETTFSGYIIVDVKLSNIHNGGTRFKDGTKSYEYKYTLVPTSSGVVITYSDHRYEVDEISNDVSYRNVARFSYAEDNNGYYYKAFLNGQGWLSSTKDERCYYYKYLRIKFKDIIEKNLINNSYFNGTINGISNVGGISGFVQCTDISQNYTTATVNGQTNVGGIIGNLDDGSFPSISDAKGLVYSNIAINPSVNAMVSNAGRIYGFKKDETWILGDLGSNKTNKALLSTSVIINGIMQNITEDLQNGNTVGAATLKKKATYQGIGWEMTNDWNIQETESYPYKPWQTSPPVILSGTEAGSTTITGKSIDNGTVFVEVGGKTYTAAVTDNMWTVSVDPLQAGAQVRVYAKEGQKVVSYSATSYVTYPGSGTEADPYQIRTAEDLASINGNGHYKLMNDIDLKDWISKNSPTNGWIPLGRYASVASALDGDNHVITGLWTNTADNYTALIANASGATIKNLTVKVAEGKTMKGGNYTAVLLGKGAEVSIENCTVEGTVVGLDYAGCLAGDVISGSIEGCTASGSVKGTAHVGGIAGRAMASVSGCKSNTNVEGTVLVGGISGSMAGSTDQCAASGNIVVTESAGYAGGITGYIIANGSISECMASGTVVAQKENSYAGGIAGISKEGSSVSDCYSTATITGTAYVAGVVAYSKGTVKNSYATGDLTGIGWGAGIVAYNDGEVATTKNCVALSSRIELTESTGTAKRVIGGYKNGAPDPVKTDNYALADMVLSINGVTQSVSDNILNATAKAADVLMSAASYEALGWDMESIWGIDEGTGYPFLQWDNASTEPEILPGDVDGDSEISVTDVQAIITMILHKTDYQDYSAVPLTPKAADLDGDGEVSVTDAAYVIDMILRSTSMKSKRRVAAAVESDLFELGNPVALGDNMYRVDVLLKDYVDMTAAQFELHLPDGMTLCDYESGDKHHSVSHRSEESERFVCFSNGNKAFRSNVVVTLTVRNDNSSWGLLLSNIELVRSNLTKVRSAREHLGEDAPTCIQNLDVDRSEPLYDMQGRRVQRARSGIYIQNGKKVLVK